ncbi:MAG: methyltransferase domain-containing protein [bacterium]
MQKIEQESIKQFDLWAKFHQIFSPPFYFLNKRIAKIVNPLKNTSVLDIGCGWGLLLKELLLMNRGLKLYGIDISPKMVSVAKLKFSSADTVEILEGSADKLPYENRSFEYVTCILSFHHHPNSFNSLKEMFRVLKPGGKLFLLDPFTNGFIAKFMIFVSAIVFQEKDVHIYTKENMLRMFEEVGFTNIQQQVCTFYHQLIIGEKKLQ